MRDGFQTGFPFRRGDGVFERGRREGNDFPAERRGDKGFFVGNEIAAFFQCFENLGAGGFGADALGFLERGPGVSIGHKTMNIGHCFDKRSLGEAGRRRSLFLQSLHVTTVNAITLFQRRQGLFIRIIVLIVMAAEGSPTGVKDAPSRGFPAGIGKGNNGFLRLVAHGRVELQTKGRGDHEVEIAFLLRE